MSRPLAFVVAAFAALVLPFTPAAKADDLKALEGTWRAVSLVADGKPVDTGDLQGLELTIKGDRYSVNTKDGQDIGTLKLDETQNPRTMDATKTEGLDAGKQVKAIYQIDGDTLKVCVASENGERPTELAGKEG
jgi:uncharacterized protein (TIGR03067 family)